MKGIVISGVDQMEMREDCPLPEEIVPTGALIQPEIWSPCTSNAHLCAAGCASLPYLLGNTIPYGILYSSEPSDLVKRFLKAMRGN